MDSVHPDRRHAIDAPGHGEIDLAGHLEDTEVLRSRERFQRLDIAGRGFSGPHGSSIPMLATPMAPSSYADRPSGPGTFHHSFCPRQDPEQRIRRRLQDIRASRWTEFAGLTMADAAVDRRWSGRGDYYNGGGGGSRKRSRRDFEDDSRPPPRREYREPLSIRIRRQVLTIADSPLRDPEADVRAVAKLISDHHENDFVRRELFDLLPLLASEQPLKSPFAASILIQLNQTRPELAGEILGKFAERSQAALDAGEWRTFKLLLRFLASVQSLLEDYAIVEVLLQLFDRAVDLQAASSVDTIGPEIVRIIMLTLPYLLLNPDTHLQEKASEILNDKTAIVASGAPPFDDIISPYVSMESGQAPSTQTALTLLQAQLQNEAATDWELSFMMRPYQPQPAEVDGMDGDVEDTTPKKHPSPSITVPEVINPGPRTLFPEVYFSLYADQDIETVPPTSNLAASIIRDSVVDTLNILDFNRSITAQYLVNLDCYFPKDTFVKRATPFDKLRDNPEIVSTWKTEDLAVDAIFSQILLLPAPEHKLVYYHSMVTETCKIAPGAIAPSLGRAIRYLYRNSESLDLELCYRFMDWFSHHLSNFDYRWKWIEWTDDLNLSPLHPKKAFITSALDKEIRLSFAKRIRETLPEEYHAMIPRSKDNEIPTYKYNLEQTPYSTEAKSILQHLKKKAAEEEIQTPIDAIHQGESERLASSEAEPSTPLLASTDAYMTSLCYIGSKSLSHVLSYIERHKDRLISLGHTNSQLRLQIISSVVDYWRETQAGVAVNIVDKLLNYTIILPSSVVEWGLVDQRRLDAGKVLCEGWFYEMVAGTMAKVTGRLRQIVAARNQRGLPQAHVDQLDDTLNREMNDMRTLFSTIKDALASVADGSNDMMMEAGIGEEVGEKQGGEMHGAEELPLLKLWGQKWLRVFQRKEAVEEKVVSEAMKMFPPAGEEPTNGAPAEDVELKDETQNDAQDEDLIDLE